MSELTRHRFSVDDYHRMVDAGLLDEDDHVELLNGEVVEMAPIGSRHAGCVKWLSEFLAVALRGRVVLGVQDPMRLSEHSEPQPDVMVLRPRADYYASGHPEPADVLLLIEVADTTVGSDRRDKLPLYAAAGVDEVWLIDLPANRIQSFRRPGSDGYDDVSTHRAGDRLAPVAFSDVVLAVAELFAVINPAT